MALYNPIMTKYGIEAEYWKITSIYLIENREQIVAEITLSGYYNPESSTAGEPLEQYIFIWRGDDYPFKDPVDVDFKTTSYNKIKLDDNFINSDDV